MLAAQAHNNRAGSDSILVTNLYNPGEKIEIPLNPALSLKENGLRYFKLYKKAKKGEAKIALQLAKTEEELNFLNSLLDQLAHRKTHSLDFQDIWQELRWRGYLPAGAGKKAHGSVQKKSSPYKFLSSSGIPILAGRNSRQNEYLTFHLAGKEDFWLHVKNLSGAHVIVKSRTPDQTTLEEAALLAAWLSKAKNSAQVPVDYTRVRHVQKMPGSRPGQVIYKHFKTFFVTPDKELFQHLQEVNEAL